jgi:phenylacetate-CoA ligase
MSREQTDQDRYPTLTESGRRMLQFLREHPHAPLYRNQSGNRLRAEDIERVRAFERSVLSTPVLAPPTPPDWLWAHVTRCFEQVPYYRKLGSMPAQFAELPTVNRSDLSRDIADFVPDSAPVSELINFRTSGTTGHPLLLASHPVVAASYLAFHKLALRRFGIELQHGSGQVGVVLVGLQRKCFTYVSVTPTMNDSGLAKINLHPDDWRDPSDRAKYLDALNPEVYAGDPLSFAELRRLELKTRPRALLSTSMALLPGLRAELEQHFGCSVLDLYSMNEAGPIAVFDAAANGHVLLQHCMYVELLDNIGMPVANGERGEVTLTGGFNFCLPLLRYRTGDFATLGRYGSEGVLLDLEGRPPIRFRTTHGEWLNNIEITHALQRFAIPQFTLHQTATGALRFRYLCGTRDSDAIRDVLLDLFGAAQTLELEEVPSFGDKVVQYTSDL